jgi:nucleotide-binding universal stress UspA family protein
MDDGAYARTDILRRRAHPRPTSRPTGAPQVASGRILCLVDLENDGRDSLTATSMAALRYATTLAVASRARITALHVVPCPPQQTTSLTDITQRLRRSVSGEGLRDNVDVQTAAGSLNEELFRVARNIAAGLIVLAGDEPKRASLSDFADVLRQAPCPVLIVHPSERAAVA